MTRTTLAIALAATLAAPTVDILAKDPPPKLKALLIAGGCCHDYPNQNVILSEGISQRARVEWTIVLGKKDRKTVLDVYQKKDWAKGYDVIVHNECYGAVDDVEFVERIAEAHRQGTPGVVIHCSMHSYRAAKTDKWRKFLGVTSTSHERGRPLTVKPLKPDHPILADFPESWDTPNGELYKIEKLWPKTVPLAKAYGKDTKKDHVVVWTNEFGKGRVFGTTLGHHNETMEAEVYLDLVTRGLLWACGKLDDNGDPFEGYAAEASSEKEKKAAKKKAADGK